MASHRLLSAALLLAGAVAAQNPTFSWDFNAGQDGWEGGYSDYSGESDFQFQFARAALPKPLDTTKFGLKLNGMNRSDDMFMFLRRKVEGLAPAARYDVRFKVRLASKYANDAIGIGGAPGTSVYLKIGAVAVKPVDESGRMNVDKGNQSQPGSQMDTIGHVGAGNGVSQYTTIERGNAGRVFTFTTAADGSAWIILGTDSGFEGLTTLYYQSVEAAFTKQGGTALGAAPKRAFSPAVGAGGVRADGKKQRTPGGARLRIFNASLSQD